MHTQGAATSPEYALGRQQREGVPEAEAHLAAKFGEGPCACPVLTKHSIADHIIHQLQVLQPAQRDNFHVTKSHQLHPCLSVSPKRTSQCMMAWGVRNHVHDGKRSVLYQRPSLTCFEYEPLNIDIRMPKMTSTYVVHRNSMSNAPTCSSSCFAARAGGRAGGLPLLLAQAGT